MANGAEFDRLARLRPFLAGDGPDIEVGVGDDAAVLRVGDARVVVCSDAVVQDVHFSLAMSRPEDVGWKAIAVNASDLAAMGATPLASTVVLQRSPQTSEEMIDALYAGMAEAANRYGLPIVGGDTVDGAALALSVTAIGQAGARVVRRDGARDGDLIGLVGDLGASAAALHADAHDMPIPDELLAAHRRPQALDLAGPALASGGATAMIDVSDGLGADASHIAAASHVRLVLDEQAVIATAHPQVAQVVTGPDGMRLVVSGGEDFALLATIPPDRWDDAAAAVSTTGQGLLRLIGRVTDGAGVTLTAPDGDVRDIADWGYRHG